MSNEYWQKNTPNPPLLRNCQLMIAPPQFVRKMGIILQRKIPDTLSLNVKSSPLPSVGWHTWTAFRENRWHWPSTTCSAKISWFPLLWKLLNGDNGGCKRVLKQFCKIMECIYLLCFYMKPPFLCFMFKVFDKIFLKCGRHSVFCRL